MFLKIKEIHKDIVILYVLLLYSIRIFHKGQKYKIWSTNIFTNLFNFIVYSKLKIGLKCYNIISIFIIFFFLLIAIKPHFKILLNN